MSARGRKILIADLLCGAGGSSTGAIRALLALGFRMEDIVLTCVNHWQTAINTHTRNHPEARHYVQDIATVRPHLLVPEGYLDLLMASPTCTHHSVARGGKPTSDQQRSDPWHIITWLTELRVKRLIIENVWEFIGWGPVDAGTGKPIASRKGEYFHAWIETLRRLGFDPEWRKLNAADYGDATTRQRFILMARSDRRRVVWPVATHRRRAEVACDLFGSTSQPWRPAREIIDWSLRGKSIFDRPKPLAPKTMARIYAGAVKHDWPAPFLVILRNHMAERGIDMPLPTIAAGGAHIGLAQPVLVNMKKGAAARSDGEPLPTQTSEASHIGIAEPFILNRHGDGYGSSRAHGLDAPAPTANCDGGGYLVEPLVLSQASGGAPRAVGEPIPTQTTGGNGAAHALITPYYGSGSGESCVSADEPLPTCTAKARFGMVVPVTQSGGGATARDVDQPIPTMTTAKGGEFAIVMPVTHDDTGNRARDAADPLPTVTGANRGELAFIVAQFGEREGQTPRVHGLGEPAPTICATGRVNLVEGHVEEEPPRYDILFRMLEPHELAAAMGFNTEEATYEFTGTKTEQIKQIGNAVSVAKMQACVSALMADAAPAQRLEAAE